MADELTDDQLPSDSTRPELRERIRALPTGSGVYLMKDGLGRRDLRRQGGQSAEPRRQLLQFRGRGRHSHGQPRPGNPRRRFHRDPKRGRRAACWKPG